MPVARTYSIALVGVEGHPVEIESDIENGLPGLLLVGLPDTALREARDRIRAAIINSGEQWPQRRITVGLSPASLPKRGSGFDLGIAVSILAAAGAFPLPPSRGSPSWVSSGWTGGCGRSAGFSRPWRARPPPGSARSLSRKPARRRRPWCRGCRCSERLPSAALLAWLRGGARNGAGGHGADVRRRGRRQRRLRARPSQAAAGTAGRSARCGGTGTAGPSRSAAVPTWPTSSGSPRRAGPPKSARPAAITSRCWGRQARARPCSPSGSRPSCPPLDRACRAGGHRDPFGGRDPARGQPADDRAAVLRAASHRDQGGDRRRRQRRHPARRGVPRPSAAACSSTRHPNSAAMCWTPYGSHWSRARSWWPGRA